MRVGIDVGYSGVKLCYGTGAKPARLTLPVGAAPIDRCPTQTDGTPNLGGGHAVAINNQYWVAGVQPDHLVNFKPRLDDSYPASDEYLALYYAALLTVGVPVIDVLVTGLPVGQYKDKAKRDALASRLKGTHYVRSDFRVEIKRVVVVPQPAGAYAAQSEEGKTPELSFRRDDTVICCDPGHFSFDWVVGRGGLRLESSGHTPIAGAAILSKAKESLDREYGCVVSPQKLDRALRDNRNTIWAGRHEIVFRPAIERAARDVVLDNVKEMQGSVRAVSQSDGLDVMLVTGGGAELFAPALQEAFGKNTRIIVAEEPVTANARGFYYLAGEVR